MNKIKRLLISIMMIGGLTACSQNKDTPTTNNPQLDKDKVLVVWFGVMETDGTDTQAGASRIVTSEGVVINAEYVATFIQKQLNASFYKIETTQDYPASHEQLLEFARDERNNNARPELKTEIENFDKYDTIFIGYPNWNSDLPMPLYSFLNQYDFSDKTIIPIITHGGSGFSNTIQTISDLAPKATVLTNGLSVSRNNVASSADDIKNWLDQLDF